MVNSHKSNVLLRSLHVEVDPKISYFSYLDRSCKTPGPWLCDGRRICPWGGFSVAVVNVVGVESRRFGLGGNLMYWLCFAPEVQNSNLNSHSTSAVQREI